MLPADSLPVDVFLALDLGKVGLVRMRLILWQAVLSIDGVPVNSLLGFVIGVEGIEGYQLRGQLHPHQASLYCSLGLLLTGICFCSKDPVLVVNRGLSRILLFKLNSFGQLLSFIFDLLLP